MGQIAARKKATPARPLPVLVPLIRRELKEGYDAGIEHYRAAGEMLNEAKGQLKHGEWTPWLDRNFHLSSSTAQDYMRLAKVAQKPGAGNFSSMRAATRPEHNSRATWTAPVRESLARGGPARLNFKALHTDRQAKEKETRLTQKLGLQLIDIGYKVLATKLHPDKSGGSDEAMARLNKVRDLLRASI